MVHVIGYCYPRGEPDTYNGPRLNDSTLEEHARRLKGIPIHHEHPDNTLDHADTPKVGQIVDAQKDKDGIRVVIKLNDKSPAGWKAIRAVESGKLHSLSIGGGFALDKPGGRVLGHRITEVSLTDDPALEGTRITAMEPVPEMDRTKTAALRDKLVNFVVYNRQHGEVEQKQATMSNAASTSTPTQQPQHVPTPNPPQDAEAITAERIASMAAKIGATHEEIKAAMAKVDTQQRTTKAKKEANNASKARMLGALLYTDKKKEEERIRKEIDRSFPEFEDYITAVLNHVGKDPKSSQVYNNLKDRNGPTEIRTQLLELASAASRHNADNIRAREAELQKQRDDAENLRLLSIQQQVELDRLRKRQEAMNHVDAVSGRKRSYDETTPTPSTSSPSSASAASSFAASMNLGPTLFDDPDTADIISNW